MNASHAEAAILGGLMCDNARFHDVAPILSADHFTVPLHRRMWAIIRERILGGEPADAVTIGESAPDLWDSAIDLAQNAAGASNVVAYAGIVRDNWRRREAVAIAGRLIAGAKEQQDGAIDAAIGDLIRLNAIATECDYSLRQAMHAAFQQIQTAYENGGALPGITTGLSRLDDILGGWHNSDLSIIGARPAMGKTALMICLAEAAAKSGKSVGLISAEQPHEQIGLRTISLGSRAGAADLRRGKIDELAWGRISETIKACRDLRLRIYDRSAITLDELVGVARKWKHAHGLEALFIDYAQRISVPGCDRITEVATVARGLKNLARDLNIPVIALAQVKAAVDQRTDKRPTAGDLANSDELTREADQILMLYRESAYYREKNERGEPVREGMAEILIEKNRHGPTGYVETAFIASTMRFADLEHR